MPAVGVEVDAAKDLDATERLADPSSFESEVIRHVVAMSAGQVG